MEASVWGDLRRLFNRIGVVPQSARIESPAVGIELVEFPAQQRLRCGRQSAAAATAPSPREGRVTWRSGGTVHHRC